MFRIINNLKNRKGFTLIELIVVLAVLAIIMAIAVPRFMGVRESAALDSDISTIASVAKLVELEFVRQNITEVTNNKTADDLGINVEELIVGNFANGLNFQSEELKGGGIASADVVFDENGSVKSITVEVTDVNKKFTRNSEGKFKLDN
jgi:prepilin-type N-terminal cleavage/methylation domain-containing protein